MTKISFLQAAHAQHLPLPSYQTAGAAGMDLQAALGPEIVTLMPGMRTAVPTGLHLSLPPTMEAQIRPRSGLALKQGLTVVNATGTIDSDYRGRLRFCLSIWAKSQLKSQMECVLPRWSSPLFYGLKLPIAISLMIQNAAQVALGQQERGHDPQ